MVVVLANRQRTRANCPKREQQCHQELNWYSYGWYSYGKHIVMIVRIAMQFARALPFGGQREWSIIVSELSN